MRNWPSILLLAAAIPSAAAAQQVRTLVPRINASGDVSVDRRGRVYVADFGSKLGPAGGSIIYRISPRGDAEIFSRGFKGASGNEFGRDDFLYQSDIGAGEVYRISPQGRRQRLAKGLASPVGIAPNADGTVFVTQCAANKVSQIMTDGEVRMIAEGTPLKCPNGLVIGPDGGLFTTNFFDGDMIRIDIASGKMSVHAVIPGGGNGHLAVPNGRFFVASWRGNRIFEVDMDGSTCAIAGSGEPGNGDGKSTTATLFRPNGVALSPDGTTLYTNTMARTVERSSLFLHPNAVRMITGIPKRSACKST